MKSIYCKLEEHLRCTYLECKCTCHKTSNVKWSDIVGIACILLMLALILFLRELNGL